MESDELVRLIKILKENKIEKFKGNGVDIEFSHDAFYEPAKLDIEKEDENLLLYSAGIKLKRNAHGK